MSLKLFLPETISFLGERVENNIKKLMDYLVLSGKSASTVSPQRCRVEPAQRLILQEL